MERHQPVTSARLRDLIRSDIEAATHENFRLYGRGAFWARAVVKLFLGANVRAVVAFRVGHVIATRGAGPLALWLRTRTLRRSGAEIHPRAEIGPGFFLVHTSGVVIGPDVVIGARCRMHQGVTLGEPVHVGDGVWRGPRVGDDVVIGAHAVLLGAVTVGNNAQIGANAVVTQDVEAGTTVVGVPARTVARRPD